MNKKAIYFTLIVCIVLLNSCFSFPGLGTSTGNNSLFGGNTGSDSSGGTGSLFGGPERRTSEAASASLGSSLGFGIAGMMHQMMFTMMYSQVFFIGGFGASLYELEETQGMIWRMEVKDENGSTSKAETERALLKKLPDGERWWYLAWRVDKDEFEYEGLIDKDMNVKKVRYYDPDNKRVEEFTFDDAASGGSQGSVPKEPASSSLDFSELPRYSKGSETLRINAGTYNTERFEWQVKNEDDGSTYNYKWWVDDKTKIGLVKYEWTKSRSKESSKGELYSVKMGYKTKFNSF